MKTRNWDSYKGTKHHNFIKRISDLDRFNDTRNATLLQDSQEIAAVAENTRQNLDEYGCLFVIIGDGDYISIWGCWSYVPYLNAHLTRIL